MHATRPSIVSLQCAPGEAVQSRIDLSVSLLLHTHTSPRKNASLQVAPVLFASLVVGWHSSGHDATQLRRAFAQYSGMAPAAALLPLAGPSRAAETTFASPANAASGVVLTSQQTARTEFISGLIAGAAQKTIKEIVLHPLDTVKCRLQVASPSRRSLFEAALYEDAYSGIAPALISGAPAASVFFAVKDAVKQQLTSSIGSGTLTTLVAVACANGPYWVVRNPRK